MTCGPTTAQRFLRHRRLVRLLVLHSNRVTQLPIWGFAMPDSLPALLERTTVELLPACPSVLPNPEAPSCSSHDRPFRPGFRWSSRGLPRSGLHPARLLDWTSWCLIGLQTFARANRPTPPLRGRHRILPTGNPNPARAIDSSRAPAQQAVEGRRPHLVVTSSVLPLARGEVPRARSSSPVASSFAGAAAAERRYVGRARRE